MSASLEQNTTVVLIPTYNERENLPSLISALLALKLDVDVLIIDDNSPDGTGALADDLSQQTKAVHVLHRTKKQGLGAAYAAGFTWALKQDYQYIISMDADFSHDPADLPSLIATKDDRTVVIGSRYIRGGKIVGCDWRRYLNSWGANIATRLLLGLPARDTTAGFKCYPRSFLADLDLNHLLANGYAFQVEMLLSAVKSGYRLQEVPITFVDRRAGKSKISGELGRSAKVVLQLAMRRQGLRQLVRFAIIGAINSVIDFCIFFLLLKTPLGTLGQVGKQVAKASSFLVAVASSYLMNRRWTFRSSERRIVAQAGKFLLVSLVGLGFNNLAFYVFNAESLLHLNTLLSLILATATVSSWNFLANKYWTFRA